MAEPDRNTGRTLAALGAAAAVTAGFSVAWAAREAHRFTLREVTVPALTAGAAPVRVLHISDLHMIPSQTDKIAWLRDLASLRPDLVVNTGDNFGHVEALAPLLGALEPLLGLPGAFVLGSNDYYAPKNKNPLRYFLPDSRQPVTLGDHTLPADEFAAALRSAGWKDLTNRRSSLTLPGVGAGAARRISLVGVDDPHIGRDDFPAPVLPAAASTHRTAPSDSDARTVLRLGVTHAPYRRVLGEMLDDGSDLILAGHTHGGQLCLPGYGALVTNCDIDRRRASGLHGWPGPRPDAPGATARCGCTSRRVSAQARRCACASPARRPRRCSRSSSVDPDLRLEDQPVS